MGIPVTFEKGIIISTWFIKHGQEHSWIEMVMLSASEIKFSFYAVHNAFVYEHLCRQGSNLSKYNKATT